VGSATLGANYLVAGKAIRITAKGIVGTDAVDPTLRIRVRLGGIAGTVVMDTTAVLVGIGTNNWFEAQGIITCRTTGGAGTVFSQGQFQYREGTGDNTKILPMANTTTTAIDTTVSQEIVVSAEWGTADADNTITSTNIIIETLN